MLASAATCSFLILRFSLVVEQDAVHRLAELGQVADMPGEILAGKRGARYSNWLPSSAATVRSNTVGVFAGAMSEVSLLIASRPPQAASSATNRAMSSAWLPRKINNLRIVYSWPQALGRVTPCWPWYLPPRSR